MFGKKFLQPSYHRRLKKIAFVLILASTLFVVIVTTGVYGLSVLDSSLPHFEPEAVVGRPEVTPSVEAYRLESPLKSDFSRGQSKIIDDLLGAQKDGFFVELGAGDGETNSVSLFFERERNWHGILVEASEKKLRLVEEKKRRAQPWNYNIRLDDDVNPDIKNGIRLDRLFQMINHTTIDLLVINLNGSEAELIKQLDLDKYRFRVITIELQNDVSKEKYMAITDHLTSRGYTVAHHLVNSIVGKKDIVYTKL